MDLNWSIILLIYLGGERYIYNRKVGSLNDSPEIPDRGDTSESLASLRPIPLVLTMDLRSGKGSDWSIPLVMTVIKIK